MVLVDLTAATICFLGQCYPVLFGASTPVGHFQMTVRQVISPGYGGDVIQFTENETTVLAIHRLWVLNPNQHRDKRIKSSVIKDRIITNGCINVMPEVYEKLKDCCSNDELVISK